MHKGAEDSVNDALEQPDDSEDIMSRHTIKEASPFTAAFENQTKSLLLNDKSESTKPNAHYSPSSFSCVKEIIHLIPLWSCLLQSNVTRLASDGVQDDKNFTIRCLSNGTVEAHFKNLKHGRMCEKLKVRPRAFVEAELEYVIGKLNELELKNAQKMKTKRTSK